MRTYEEVQAMINRAETRATEVENGETPGAFSESYEQGVYDALAWVVGAFDEDLLDPGD